MNWSKEKKKKKNEKRLLITPNLETLPCPLPPPPPPSPPPTITPSTLPSSLSFFLNPRPLRRRILLFNPLILLLQPLSLLHNLHLDRPPPIMLENLFIGLPLLEWSACIAVRPDRWVWRPVACVARFHE